MTKLNFKIIKNRLVVLDHQGKTVAHINPDKIRWFCDPGVGIRQKINKMAISWGEINDYGNFILK